MASPPFSLSTSLPGDGDVVSQFPGNERPNRDIIQSWILANHDNNGNHLNVIFPWQGSAPTTPSASLTLVYADAVGRLKIRYPDGSIGFVGTPPATVFYTAGPTPVGYLVADGSAVSRSTYADLFASIGGTYGGGDGATTFNLPDLNGRVVAGEDNSAGRLTSAFFGSTASLAATGGAQSNVLIASQVPQIISANATQNIIVTSNNNDIIEGVLASGLNTSGVFKTLSSASANAITSSGSNSISVLSTNTGGLGHNNVQPTIILKAIIKT